MDRGNDRVNENSWFVYLVRCSDQSLYCGVTIDVERRVHEHNHSPKGAKYTKFRRPVVLVYQQSALDRSAACKLEAQIKKLSKVQKERLVSEFLAT